MARMSELMLDIEEMLREGFTADEVATKFGVPFQWVKQIEYAMDFEENE